MNRRGIALVLLLVAMTVAALLAAGLLVTTSTQARASGDAGVALSAGEAAERGHILAAASWVPESSLTMPPGATLGAIVTRYADSSTSTTWLTRLTRESFWVSALGHAAATGTPAAVERRIIALYRPHMPDLRLTATISVRDSLRVFGAATVSGSDTPPPAWGALCAAPTASVAATAAPDTSRICDGPCGGSGATRLIGVAPKLLDSAAALALLQAQLGPVTWTSLVAHATRVFPGTATVTPMPSLTGGGSLCDTTATANWGDPGRATACRNRFVIVHAQGDLVIDGGIGQGVILGDGDIELRNGAQFVGVILARDDLIALTGANQLWGAALAGDARRASGDVSVIAGATAVTYSSCAVEMALLGTAPLRREAHRGWMPGH